MTNNIARTNEHRQDEQHCQNERISSQLTYTSHVSPTKFESDERGQSKMFLIKWTNAQFYFTVGKI